MYHVLIVDDEKNVLKTLSIGLERYDYIVEQAKNGPEALNLLSKKPCDLVITDIRMSPIDGYSLATQIKGKYPETRIILMSAYGFEEDQQIQSTLEFPRITKPFSVEELVNKIQAEEKKFEKINFTPVKILILGDPENNQKIQEELVEWGFQTKILLSENHIQDIIHNMHYDLFLIDEEIFETGDWKILNTIDQYAPGKPLIILTQGKSQYNHYLQKNLRTSIIDRNTLLQNQLWTNRFLTEHLDNTC